MIFKKALSLLLAFSTIFQLSSVVFAADKEGEQMQNALLALKDLIDIPEGYKDFIYSSEEYVYGAYKMNVWDFNWEYEKGSISAAIDEKGNLCSYRKYSYDKENKVLSNISMDEAKKTADGFLKKITQENYFEIKEDINKALMGDSYKFEYKKYVNDIPVNFDTIRIEVNKFSGEIASFYKSNYDNRKLDFPTGKDIINYDAAKNEYISKLGIKLEYHSYYDYKTKKINVFPVYSIEENSSSAINAQTGEIVNLKEELELRSLNTEAAADSEAGGLSNKLSKEELEGIENVSSLITKENAEGIIRKYFNVITSDVKLESISLIKSYMENKYMWEVQFDNGSFGHVDAKTGEILFFVDMSGEDKTENKLKKDEAQKIAYDFLETVAKEKLSQTKLKELEDELEEDDNSNVFIFNFIRQVNGIDFSWNSLSVTINNGKITFYENDWNDNIDFPSIKNVMSQDDIFDKISEHQNFGLKYVWDDKDNLALVYNFDTENNNYLYEPFNGKRIDYQGKEYKDNSIGTYGDVEGHWCESIVNKLLENGYYIEGDSFNPDSKITQINFFKYLYSPSKYDNDDDFYDMLVRNKVIKQNEIKPESYVTKIDAAKYIIRYLNYDDVAKVSKIYNDGLFKDEVPYNDIGYANICYGLGIISLDDNDKFNPDDNITNADTAQIIYNLLSIK